MEVMLHVASLAEGVRDERVGELRGDSQIVSGYRKGLLTDEYCHERGGRGWSAGSPSFL